MAANDENALEQAASDSTGGKETAENMTLDAVLANIRLQFDALAKDIPEMTLLLQVSDEQFRKYVLLRFEVLQSHITIVSHRGGM